MTSHILMPWHYQRLGTTIAVEEKGLGVQIQYPDLAKDALLENFKIVLDPEFRKRAKEISREWHDRPLSAMDAAMFWTEYAARHPRASLRIPAVGMPAYQLIGLDVLFAVVSLFLASVFAVKYLVWGRKKPKSKSE